MELDHNEKKNKEVEEARVKEEERKELESKMKENITRIEAGVKTGMFKKSLIEKRKKNKNRTKKEREAIKENKKKTR